MRRRSTRHMLPLPVAFNCYELYSVQLCNRQSINLGEYRFRISRLTLNRMRLLMDFLWLNCDLSLVVCREVFHSFSCLLAIVVTFNFKFSKIIICCTIQFFLWFQFAAERSAAKRFIVLRMDEKIVSGTDGNCSSALLYFYWIDYIQRILQKPI